MKVDGSCHCGAIAYSAEVDPAAVWLCHCTDCQTLSGSPFRAVVGASSFTLEKGELKTYVKTAASGTRRRQTFCADCGTPIYGAPDEEKPSGYGLRWGSIKQRTSLSPAHQYWCRSAQAWAAPSSAIPEDERE